MTQNSRPTLIVLTATLLSLAGLASASPMPNIQTAASGLSEQVDSLLLARRGADDPAGDDRGGKGKDDPAGHATLKLKPADGQVFARRGRGADDPAGHSRRGRGKDDPVGHG